MKILNSEQIKKLDRSTIQEEDITSLDLMERAGRNLTKTFRHLYGDNYAVVIICGPGNNGGDGLVMARLLFQAGYRVNVWEVDIGKTSDDHKANLAKVPSEIVQKVAPQEPLPAIIEERPLVFIDALFGSGLSRPIEGDLAGLVNSVNRSGHDVVAIDMPSGLKDDEAPEGAIVQATYTLTIHVPRLNLFLASCHQYVGQWTLVDIGLSDKAMAHEKTDLYYLDEEMIQAYVPRSRSPFSHKGSMGHALMICGSHGMMGASLLATEACLRSGPGKVTSHVPGAGRDITHIKCPEALVSVDEHDYHISSAPFRKGFDSIGIGCGLGKSPGSSDLVKELLVAHTPHLVIDADALNIISTNGWLGLVPSGSILTPHPGEFKRLVGKGDLSDRMMIEHQKTLAIEKNLTVVLKGHYTSIALPNGRIFFNSTGNPGMATGGSGDVLTGIITGLLAQYKDPVAAAVIGVYLHGLAGDLALDTHSYESLLARDIIDYLGEAFKEISYR